MKKVVAAVFLSSLVLGACGNKDEVLPEYQKASAIDKAKDKVKGKIAEIKPRAIDFTLDEFKELMAKETIGTNIEGLVEPENEGKTDLNGVIQYKFSISESFGLLVFVDEKSNTVNGVIANFEESFVEYSDEYDNFTLMIKSVIGVLNPEFDEEEINGLADEFGLKSNMSELVEEETEAKRDGIVYNNDTFENEDEEATKHVTISFKDK